MEVEENSHELIVPPDALRDVGLGDTNRLRTNTQIGVKRTRNNSEADGFKLCFSCGAVSETKNLVFTPKSNTVAAIVSSQTSV